MRRLTEPLAVGVHAVEKAMLKGAEAPLVVGCGPVGLAVIAALRLKNYPADCRRRLLAEAARARVKMGADVVVDPAKEDPYSKLAPGKRAAIFECVGVPGLIQQTMEKAPRDARVVVVGVCMESDTIEPMFGIVKELNLQFVLGYTPEEFSRSLRLLAEGQVDAPSLITAQDRARWREGRLRGAGKSRAPHENSGRTLALEGGFPMKFYNSVGPNPRMVRMFMAEKGIDIPKVEVDLRAGENRKEPYLKVNPPARCRRSSSTTAR
jgi:hypothetical protein